MAIPSQRSTLTLEPLSFEDVNNLLLGPVQGPPLPLASADPTQLNGQPTIIYEPPAGLHISSTASALQDVRVTTGTVCTPSPALSPMLSTMHASDPACGLWQEGAAQGINSWPIGKLVPGYRCSCDDCITKNIAKLPMGGRGYILEPTICAAKPHRLGVQK